METVVMTMTIADLPVMLSSGKKKSLPVRVSDQAEVYLKHHYMKTKKQMHFNQSSVFRTLYVSPASCIVLRGEASEAVEPFEEL